MELSCGECDVISLYFTVFLNCLVKQFAIFLGVVVTLLYNVMEMLSVDGDGGALLDRMCMVFQRMCVLCLDLSVHLDVPFIGCVYVCVCQK